MKKIKLIIGILINSCIYAQVNFKAGISTSNNSTAFNEIIQGTGIEAALNIPIGEKTAINISSFGQYFSKGEYNTKELLLGLSHELRIFSKEGLIFNLISYQNKKHLPFDRCLYS